MRFSRTELLVGPGGMERLRRARVAVFGLGGVGSFALEAIARAGVGRILVVDFDSVGPSNINRQILALEDTVGRPKVEVAMERVRMINPAAEIEARKVFLSPDNMEECLKGDFGYAIDAIDGINPKVHLLVALHRKSVPFVSCMGAASRLNPVGIRVSDISGTRYCPLARTIRKRLKRFGINKGVRCVYSEENLGAVFEPEEIDEDMLEETIRRGRRRRVQGSISYMPGIFGLTAAGVIIRDILEG